MTHADRFQVATRGDTQVLDITEQVNRVLVIEPTTTAWLYQGNEAKLIFNFAVPMLIGNVFQQSYSIVDSIIVGRVIGETALAAIGVSFPSLFLLISLIIGVTMGFSVLVSQFFGAKDIEKVRRTIDTTYIFLFFGSLGASVVGIYLSEPILVLLKTPADTLPQAFAFLKAMTGWGAALPTPYAVGWCLTPELELALLAGAICAMPVLPALGRWHARLAEAGLRPAAGASLEIGATATLMLLFFASIAQMAAHTYDPFIYFRF
jgi:hypothetical protein